MGGINPDKRKHNMEYYDNRLSFINGKTIKLTSDVSCDGKTIKFNTNVGNFTVEHLGGEIRIGVNNDGLSVNYGSFTQMRKYTGCTFEFDPEVIAYEPLLK